MSADSAAENPDTPVINLEVTPYFVILIAGRPQPGARRSRRSCSAVQLTE